MLNRTTKTILASAAGVALLGTTLATSAFAEGAFNVTIAGQQPNTPLVQLETSSVQNIAISNLPANVGLYALNCAIPSNPRSAPTQCDASADSLVYIPAIAQARDSVSANIRINGEFLGTNPNPQQGATPPAAVDCRASNTPGMPTCAVYILGAGRESANPAYLKVFPTSFKAVKSDRKQDSVKVTPANNSTVTTAGSDFSATTTSGLPVSVLSDNCRVADGKISALSDSGTCTVTLSTTGGRTFKPVVKTLTYQLAK